MKPLYTTQGTGAKSPDETIPSLPSALTSSSGTHSAANRRTPTCPLQPVYPWLLCTSTAIAALFCLLYLTKPVVQSIAAPSPAAVPAIPSAPSIPSAAPDLTPLPSASAATPAPAVLMPSREHLPGEAEPPAVAAAAAVPSAAVPVPPTLSVFEETNLKIQHILTAEAPGGQLARIDLDVPVLYPSRNLRWTPDDVAEARILIVRLMDYQEKSQRLRAEGSELLETWNHLIDRSIPATELRADSPSLPANQEDAADAPRPAGLITSESIQIQPAGK